jgi:ribosomal protein S18 acetylase RimI-like enzyme
MTLAEAKRSRSAINLQWVAAGNSTIHIMLQEISILQSLLEMIGLATIRMAERGDRVALAELHAYAWRYAYRGIIPGVALERMIARRGPAWWASRCGSRHRALLLEFDGPVVSYVLFGPCRIRNSPRMGEISELYVKPECQGASFGRSLFEEARRRLRARNLNGLLVWALAENALACGFYEAMGGKERFRTFETLGGVRLEKIAFHWT